ncbi:class I glutamine amidotransferase-like protein [Podospora aff. communis PSN243]|uniref:Class I glutamine amidotransferase-like protein n=1 Tax=Podospora aff. communis PSN243 TaxID=3040156 RepID=A0AAV9G2D8_9PEZI|nr:class I glutamine amidotransferase-like protein [Podospora aff. communis PSN243]
MTSSKSILLVLFPGFNTLDMNGPYEVLRKTKSGELFNITVAAESEITTSCEGVQVKRDIPLDESLISGVASYDILLVPGGTPEPVDAQVAAVGGPFLNLLSAFAKLESAATTNGEPSRILLSICTGAIFLGALGVFNDRFCTTHWGSYHRLKERVEVAAAETAGSKPGTVVAARFVDSGVNVNGVRIISSGGVSCGIDASLYVVKLYAGEEVAKAVAQQLDYAWRKTDGFVVL